MLVAAAPRSPSLSRSGLQVLAVDTAANRSCASAAASATRERRRTHPTSRTLSRGGSARVGSTSTGASAVEVSTSEDSRSVRPDIVVRSSRSRRFETLPAGSVGVSSPNNANSGAIDILMSEDRHSANSLRTETTGQSNRSRRDEALTIAETDVTSRLCAEFRKERPNFHAIESMLAEAKRSSTSLHTVLRGSEDGSGLSPLHQAARAGSLRVVHACLDADCNVNLLSSIGRSALHYACDGDQAEVVKVLLAESADVNQVSLGGFTPLHAACQRGAEACVLALLMQPHQYVMVGLEDSQRTTPIRLAKSKLIRHLIGYYLEYPSSTCRKRWNLRVMELRLNKEEVESFGDRLRSLFPLECRQTPHWNSQDACPVCLEKFCSECPALTLECYHKVCKTCWSLWQREWRGRHSGNPVCPLCKREHTPDDWPV